MADRPSFIARLSGREDPSPTRPFWQVLIAACLFAAILTLILIFWPDAGAFIYEGF